ncbi:hypothetical protein BAE44_0017347 [Dichanthelium oligosanthes]|uniref:Uncharacterized protein n=1 Tax=Dichanthelium oligosanthes TaxID=888268 RepID=A0A1E5V9D0_9POAL|nr:hypothetical protein BAE44_0017347 [Dichanthelium oligosanthes]
MSEALTPEGSPPRHILPSPPTSPPPPPPPPPPSAGTPWRRSRFETRIIPRTPEVNAAEDGLANTLVALVPTPCCLTFDLPLPLTAVASPGTAGAPAPVSQVASLPGPASPQPSPAEEVSSTIPLFEQALRKPLDLPVLPSPPPLRRPRNTAIPAALPRRSNRLARKAVGRTPAVLAAQNLLMRKLGLATGAQP